MTSLAEDFANAFCPPEMDCWEPWLVFEGGAVWKRDIWDGSWETFELSESRGPRWGRWTFYDENNNVVSSAERDDWA